MLIVDLNYITNNNLPIKKICCVNMLTNECVTKEGPLKKSHTIHILTMYVTFFMLTWYLRGACSPLAYRSWGPVHAVANRVSGFGSVNVHVPYPSRWAPYSKIDTHNNNHYIYIYL